MKTLAGAIVLAAILSLLPRAYAGDGEACCACLPVLVALPAGPGINGTARTALFCAQATVETSEGLAERCQMLDENAKLLCLKPTSNSTCRVDLAESGILCPTSAAPAASALDLAALTIGLAALGALLLHRRRRPGSIGMEDQP